DPVVKILMKFMKVLTFSPYMLCRYSQCDSIGCIPTISFQRMGFVLVEFSSNRNKFAAVSIDKIVDGKLRELKAKLSEKTEDVFWGRRIYSVKVRGFGSQTEMNDMCSNLTECDGSNSTTGESSRMGNSAAGRIAAILNKRKILNEPGPSTMRIQKVQKLNDYQIGKEICSAVVAPQAIPETLHSIENCENEVEDPKETIAKLTAKVAKWKAVSQKHKECAKMLKRQIQELKEQQNLATSEENFEITVGTGVYMAKATLAAAKLTAKTPTILARSLFRQLFKPDEIKGCSLFGRTCNANKSAPVLPSVDGIKRDALIEYCLNTYNLKPLPSSCRRGQVSEYVVQRSRIVDSLNKLLREENCKGCNAASRSVSETCSAGRFHCENNLCIRAEKKCDGDDDCGDGSDEANCGNAYFDIYQCCFYKATNSIKFFPCAKFSVVT
ncbi:unnamed protein product, partial [Allacma fusca]